MNESIQKCSKHFFEKFPLFFFLILFFRSTTCFFNQIYSHFATSVRPQNRHIWGLLELNLFFFFLKKCMKATKAIIWHCKLVCVHSHSKQGLLQLALFYINQMKSQFYAKLGYLGPKEYLHNCQFIQFLPLSLHAFPTGQQVFLC